MLNTSIFILSLLGFISAMLLVFKNKKTPGYCLEFGSIPACYVIAFSYAFVLISRVLTLGWLQGLFFWSGSAIGLILGIWFSTHDYSANKKCPRFLTIPLCYLSCFVFLVLIILKLLM